ncbi:type III-A CRISPR-associated RAMP protein Csm5 [Brachyspira alvinipulli]|uniref:type III-A CRISPR-associated RAMP protein Csm5 n=1 Tax=Brachyspira alvinipulli TaxID=84379 RepID=UPI000481A785|nr:type III-A CRISPR-associated RAMP protein Csm5 [Brachyspira alvinipulli]
MNNGFKIADNKTYLMKLTTLSPVFIGSGEEVKKNGYIFDNNKIFMVDENKLIDFLYSKKYDIKKLTSDFFSKDFTIKEFIRKFIKKKFNEIDIYKYIIDGDISNNISTFIKSSNGNPFFPGSSIKGAIRTAIIACEIMDDRDKVYDFIKKEKIDIFGSSSSKIESFIISEMASKYNFKENSENNIFNLIKVEDSGDILEKEKKLFVSKRIDFSTYESNFNKMPKSIEFIKPNVKTFFTITVDKSIKYFDMNNLLLILSKYFNYQFEFYTKAFPDINECLKVSSLDSNNNYIYYKKFLSLDDCKPNIFLGGNNGYYSKNIFYSMLLEDFNYDYYMNKLKEHFDKNSKHKHRMKDTEISPRTLRLCKLDKEYIKDDKEYKTLDDYEELYMNIGICNLQIEKELC